MRAVENDFDGTRMTIPRARDAMGQSGDGGAFVRVHRVQTRAITMKTRTSTAWADAGDQGPDACK